MTIENGEEGIARTGIGRKAKNSMSEPVTEPKPSAGHCASTLTLSTKRYLLRFDGKSYQLPRAMKDES